MDESQIIQNAKENILHFEDLYNLYFQKVFRYFMVRTGNELLSEDLTSQTFLKALENFDKYNFNGSPFGAWLFRIGYNNLIDYYRKNKATIDPLYEIHHIKSKEDVEEATHNKILSDRIHELLKNFQAEERDILLLKLISDLKFSDIAKITGKNENTVKTKYFRTLKKLKDKTKILRVFFLILNIK